MTNIYNPVHTSDDIDLYHTILPVVNTQSICTPISALNNLKPSSNPIRDSVPLKQGANQYTAWKNYIDEFHRTHTPEQIEDKENRRLIAIECIQLLEGLKEVGTQPHNCHYNVGVDDCIIKIQQTFL